MGAAFFLVPMPRFTIFALLRFYNRHFFNHLDMWCVNCNPAKALESQFLIFMKKSFYTLLFLFGISVSAFSQEKISAIQIKDLSGNQIDASTIHQNDGKPTVVSFWATWCKPCVRELNAINDQYIDWQEETGVKLVAISIDDSRLSSKVRPFVVSQGWEYEVYLDENSELRRSLNVNNIPHTFLLNGEGEIVWQHNGYIPGDEDHLYELIEQLAAGGDIEE